MFPASSRIRRMAKARQLELMGRALAPWPRRQAPLLVINCGNGAFLPFLWQAGFDPEGVEADPEMIEKARSREIPGFVLHQATDQDIPLESDSFDWVILHLKSHGLEQMSQAAEEGLRLARRGLMITFWNSASLAAACWKLAHKKPWISDASWWQIDKILTRLNPGRVTVLSTLALPPCAWHWRLAGLDPAAWGLPIGAWCIARVDLGAQYPVTPLPLRVGTVINRQTEPLLEYTQKCARKTPR